MLSSKQIAKNLLSDTNSYSEFIIVLIEECLENNSSQKIYWDAWFRGATNKALENADAGIIYNNIKYAEK